LAPSNSIKAYPAISLLVSELHGVFSACKSTQFSWAVVKISQYVIRPACSVEPSCFTDATHLKLSSDVFTSAIWKSVRHKRP
jgi:hypothetical protein